MKIVNFDKDVCALTDIGLVRSHNEDCNAVVETHNGDLFVVCDGMGGHVGGSIASNIGVESICRYVNEHDCVIPQRFLEDAIKYANAKIYAEALARPELKGMGTTVCVVLIREDKVWYAHVGDSRIYYFNEETKRLYRLTKDHSVVQALVDKGLITETEAEYHPEKNKIRKSLGIKELVDPEPCQMPLIPANRDILLICSDGLSGMVNEKNILGALLASNDIHKIGSSLIDMAKLGGGADNITIQIMKFSGLGERKAVYDVKNDGVSIDNINKRKDSANKYHVMLIASIFFVILIGFLLYNNYLSDEEEITPIVNIVDDAYKKEIPEGESPIKFYDDVGREFHFYKRNAAGDLLINMETYTYEIGNFEQISKNGSVIYQAIEGQVKRYNRDGSLR